MTRLEEFMRANEIEPLRLARTACVSRQHLLRVRKGVADPTRHMMARLTMAAALLLRRRVRHADLFDLWETGL